MVDYDRHIYQLRVAYRYLRRFAQDINSPVWGYAAKKLTRKYGEDERYWQLMVVQGFYDAVQWGSSDETLPRFERKGCATQLAVRQEVRKGHMTQEQLAAADGPCLPLQRHWWTRKTIRHYQPAFKCKICKAPHGVMRHVLKYRSGYPEVAVLMPDAVTTEASLSKSDQRCLEITNWSRWSKSKKDPVAAYLKHMADAIESGGKFVPCRTISTDRTWITPLEFPELR